MSLGAENRQGDASFLDRAAQGLVDQGIFIAVASGNSNIDTNNFSAARAPGVCTVRATDSSDKRASFSNFGPIVDVLAPAVQVTFAWIGSNTAIMTISGTSMACPHVAGVGA